ncbi:MAG: radical SAM protein [Candidatus Omnitrophota bacterium]|jgi:lysine 2,3-aminomutase
MAGQKDSIFREKLTPYLNELIETLGRSGPETQAYQAMTAQYKKSPLEEVVRESDRLRHYQSDVHVVFEGKQLRGIERLYRRTIVIEPSSVCAAHCRWCLRGQYPIFSLREDELEMIARYCGSAMIREDVKEVLITGGDPLMVPQRLGFLFGQLKKHAPNIRIFRIGSRVPVQDPDRVDEDLMSVIKSAAPVKVEIATHVNHPAELTEKARRAYARLYEDVFKIYNQTVLLKGVNDQVPVLNELYDEMRYLGIESHYLFHCIPMRGMAHHRTSVEKGLNLIARVTSSGAFSGRAKPMFTLMTDVGKVTLYQGTILERNRKNELLIQTGYTVRDFKARNPSWSMPQSVSEDSRGYLRVWYPDGSDES